MKSEGASGDKFISTSFQDGPAVSLLNELFEEAALRKWQDLQFRKIGKKLVIQHVSDERTNEIGVEDGVTAHDMCERLKARANINVTDNRRAQDGRFSLSYRVEGGDRLDRDLDVRVNYTPTDAGETMVCRLLAAVDEKLRLENMEMSNAMRIAMNDFLREKQGILIVVGPVGSGKTTFMYAIIYALWMLGRNIKTAENPIEISFPGIDQLALTRDLTVLDAISAWLRQRTHVGLVGEVRDDATAAGVFRIGNTGTLVLTTIHADDAVMAVDRCEKLGIDRETFAQSVKMIVYTRLISAFQSDAQHQRVAPSNMARNWLERGQLYDERDTFVELPNSEFTQKVPLFEAIRMTPELRHAIVQGAPASTLRELATKQAQFETVAEAAVRFARQGRTTLSAVLALIGHSVTPVNALRLDKRLYSSRVITAAEQFDIVQRWGAAHASGRVVSLWQVVLETGYATLTQIIDAYGTDQDAENRIGFFVEHNLLTVQDMRALIDQWKTIGMKTSLYKMLLQRHPSVAGQVYCQELLEYQRGGMYALD